MEESLNYKSLFDAELATLPILIARWEDDPNNAFIVYQNDILSDKIGLWTDKTLLELLNELTEGNGEKMLTKLIDDNKLTFSFKIKDLEMKYHSRLGLNHIQITISDNTEINRLRDIEQRSKLIDTFLMIGSHELKTPINGIIGITSLLQEEETNVEKKDMLNMITEAANTLDNVVLKMLRQIYSYKTSNLINAVVDVKVGAVIKESLPLFMKYLKGRDILKENIQLNDTKEIRLPEGYINDILLELAINLKRNTPPGGKIKILTFDEKNNVHLVIENYGMGIPEKDLEKVFEPFYLHQNSMNHSSGYEYGQAGVGMGLAILKRIVDQANGKVWFENILPYEEGKENIVRLTIVLPTNKQD